MIRGLAGKGPQDGARYDSARSPREGYHLVRRTDSKFDRGAVQVW